MIDLLIFLAVTDLFRQEVANKPEKRKIFRKRKLYVLVWLPSMSESITLRSHLTGSLNDLVESASLGALGKCSLVCELVSLFADYQEEGTSLFLDAFLTDDLGRLTALIPQSSLLLLGKAPCNEAGVGTAIKKTAPLVRGCWKMYLSLSTDGFDFGLFRDSGHPLNVPLDITLRSGDVGDAKFIRITRLAQDSVRVSVHDGKELIVHFTNAKKALVMLVIHLRRSAR